MRVFEKAVLSVSLLVCFAGLGAAEEELKLPSHAEMQDRIAQPETPVAAAVSSMDPGWYAQVDAVYVQPYFTHNSAYYGQPSSAGAGDEGAINVEFDYDPQLSGRVEGGYMASTGNLGWRARYWHFNADTTAPNHMSRFGVNPTSDAIAISVGARMEDIDTFDTGRILHELEGDVLDAEATKGYGKAVVGVGLRLAEFTQDYSFDDVTTDAGSEFEANMTSRGIGPTGSIDFDHQFGNSNWGVYAGVRGSILFGSKSILADSDADINKFTYDESSLMFNGEFVLGGQWSGERFFSRFGFEAQYWSNVGNLMNSNTGGGDDESNSDFLFNGNIAFGGATLSGGVTF